MRIVALKTFNEIPAIETGGALWDQVLSSLEGIKVPFIDKAAPRIKVSIKDALIASGFVSGAVPDPGLNWHVHCFNRANVVVQCGFGNIANSMYDILKFEYLFKVNRASALILVVPVSSESRKLGSNIASFEKIEYELMIAYSIFITSPILLVGVAGEDYSL